MKKPIVLLLLLAILCGMMLPTFAFDPTLPEDLLEDNSVFSDVLQGAFYYDAVTWAYHRNITSGTTRNTFSPADSCTRAQVVTFLWRASGCPESKTKTTPFRDINSKSYYYKAVLWAAEKNITEGTSNTSFSPDATCTRAQVVTFLWRLDGVKSVRNKNNPFSDVGNTYYREAVLWAVDRNITTGKTKTTFAPGSVCTRGQFVTFLYRYMG